MKHLMIYIKKEFGKSIFDYLLLITAGVLFLISLNIFKGERLLEFVILFIFISFYILWGIYHHIIDDSLHLKVVVEYMLIAFTVMFLLKIIILP
ncbi:hypothetical protein A2767_06935 [Candidatus Roizmanbacteria bacterium RIFCSPHIGHO2_01_FULL_35_10]|uniref:Uncharacterized protein n=1 Tax=Candidatus Roizmanbacteria bacterium RIFCSPLOWO2_01_FULL_35_13 TaxID=1802055 RepID=A0A1F7I7L8_9BACT|nr:MAG: hypothetical protein A2767_06935 [Candidatus Roizmanbacteria bacterium RIFCSPHIGHO2_01_FULL_35_10]OGK39367.1 MAG: hypothetical protein A3A74_05350 [Candidatus Roizmanbacteria bacterium RIFCSPLOWO2_01_FULL_35_13]